MRQVPKEIEAPIRNWIDEKAPTPDGPPVVDAKVKIKAVHDHLIGTTRGSEGPTTGTRTYSMDVKFLAAPGTEQAAIDQLLAGLRLEAAEEPQVAGLPNGSRLFLGDDKTQAEGALRYRGDPDYDGPIVTLSVAVRVPE